jgi:flagellar hook-associated protein 1 FlgK
MPMPRWQPRSSNINQLLAQFETVNTAIIKGTISGSDVTDYLDTRDNILSKLSQEVGITFATRANNDMVDLHGFWGHDVRAHGSLRNLQCDKFLHGRQQRVTLLSSTAFRSRALTRSCRSAQASLLGLATLRDDKMVTYQNQLDEIARGVIEVFAEKDQSAAAGPDQAGLFTYAGGPGPCRPRA